MSTAISVWSRVLTPGQDALVSEEVSVQITNIVLEFDESKPASEKRSVLKMQHLTASPALLRAAAQAGYDSDDFDDEEGDSEIDSDEFGELDDDDEEDEDEDEAMADTSKLSKASTSSSKASKAAAAAPKVNRGISAAIAGGEDEDEDEDDSDDEFDEEFERQEAEVQICSFIPGNVEQFTTNLILPGEEDFVFKLSGEYKVHLFGHYIMQPVPGAFDDPPSGYDSDEMDYDSEDDDEDDDYISESELGRYDPETGLLLDDEDDDEEDDSRFMEIEEAKPSPKKVAKELPALKKEAATAKTAPAATKAAEAAPTPPATAAESAVDKSKLSKNQLKKLAKKEKAAGTEAPVSAAEKPAAAAAAATSAATKKEETKAAAPAAATKAASKKQTLPSGLVIEDNKTGTGSVAKSGNRVQMRYIGRLANGKIFDQNTKGAPFSFKLGKGEVIKGWDQGIAGMAVGGERKLVIPAALAYGKQAISGIPPNSTLTFEVKLLSIK